MAKAPKVFNFFFSQPWLRSMSEKRIGMVDLPLLSTPTLKQSLAGHSAYQTTLEQLEKLGEQDRQRHVLIVQDPFTTYYDAQVVADFVRLVERLGFQPVLLPFSPNGKAQHIKGFLTRFAKTAQKRQTSSIALRVWECQWWGSILRWCCATAMSIVKF